MNYLIRNKSTNVLKLNEAFDNSGRKKYIFEGVFTPINGESGKKNRNGRLYDKDEVLKHISYLRDRIRKEGSLLGELSHPESRFEIDLKGVSHKILDLWYDEDKQAVMGKLEVLDTPNGNIIKTLVDAGCPLYVSSRAAGTVGKDSHVHIQQMFTYDIVATPGFEEARLDRVSESLRPAVTSFLNESSVASSKQVNLASKFSVSDPNTIIEEVDESVKLNLDKNIMANNINEEEVKEPLTSKTKTPEQIDGSDGAQALGVPTAEIGVVTEDGDTEEGSTEENKEDTNQEEPTGTSEDAELIIEIEPQFASDIISVEAEFKDDNTEEEEETSKEETEEDKEDSKDKDKKEETEEVEESEDKKESEEMSLAKAKDIKKRNEETLNKYDNIIKELKTKKSVKESIIELYPFAISLSESNFSKFASLLDEDKSKVSDFIYNNAIIDVASINESWDIPLKQKIRNKNKWMALASEEDKKLYNEAPKEIQDSISESAKFFELSTKAEVEQFWANTGLRQRKQQQILNESFVDNYKNLVNPINPDNELPYTPDYIKLVEEML